MKDWTTLGFNPFMTRQLQTPDQSYKTREEINFMQQDLSVNDKKIYNLKTDKIRVSPLTASNIKVFEIYYLGLIEADITGGELDGVTYSSYILDVFVHHNFSTDFYNDNVPFYMFWGYDDRGLSVFDGNIQTFGELVAMEIDPESGEYTETKTHGSYLSQDLSEEYILFRWVIDRTNGTITIPEQTISTQLAIMHSRYVDTLASAGAQGGGGGILYEVVDIYI